MRLIFVLASFAVIFLSMGCIQQPMGESLLSPSKKGAQGITDDTSTIPDDGSLGIQPDNSELVMNVDDSDIVEITGSCVDLDRKNNRILVEVFAGEDESVDPYVSNALSDYCQNISSGLPITDKCFWVTKGVGLIEEANLSTQRSFPQCHNGRFGFSVKLGKILGPNVKYTVRYKLRTLDGLLTDTIWARTSVYRGLNTPIIDSATFNASTTQCLIITSPARFNDKIYYTLEGTVKDADGTTFNWTPYPDKTTALTDVGLSVFNWNEYGPMGVILQGLTYSFTLKSKESLVLGAPSSVSSVVNCETNRLKAELTTNPAPNTCFLRLSETSSINLGWNPGGGGAVSYQWGYSTIPNWADMNLSFTAAACNEGADTPICTQAALSSGATFYFAVREVGNTMTPQIGKWSEAIKCSVP